MKTLEHQLQEELEKIKSLVKNLEDKIESLKLEKRDKIFEGWYTVSAGWVSTTNYCIKPEEKLGNMKKLKFEKPTRVWINAVSKSNPLYKYHGKCGIAHQSVNSLGNLETTLYFTEGPVFSMAVDPLYLETKNSQSNNLKL